MCSVFIFIVEYIDLFPQSIIILASLLGGRVGAGINDEIRKTINAITTIIRVSFEKNLRDNNINLEGSKSSIFSNIKR